jgi:cobalt-zinc-cadmium efflux system outer membrane protein
VIANLLTLVLALAAGDARPPLSLGEAAALAARHAPTVEAAAARAEGADAAAREAAARLGPTLSVDGGFAYTNDPVDVFALTLKQERFSAQEFFAGDPNAPSARQDWSAVVSAGWSADVFGVARHASRAADAGRDAASLDAKRSIDGAALEAVAAFLVARRAQDSREILAARESDAARDVEIARSLFEAGTVTAADPARARASLAEIGAQRAATEAAERSGRAALARRIGTEEASRPLGPIPPPARSEPGPASSPRADVVAADLAADAAREAVASARAERWPMLSVGGRYELHAPRPGSRWGDSAAVFAGLRVPIYTSGVQSARAAHASARSHEAEASARERRGAAAEETERARGEFAAARARVDAFVDQEAAAREAREIQQERYREGAARLTDLLEARAAETAARLGALAARADLALAEANLRFALGMPLFEEEKR